MRYSRLKTDDNNIELQHGFFQSVEQPTASSRGRSCRPSRRLSLGNHHPSWEDSMKPEDTTILMYQMLLQLPSLWYPVSRLMMIISNFQKLMRHPLPSFFHTEMMGDIMYYHQAMTQNDAPKFTGAVIKEVNGSCLVCGCYLSHAICRNMSHWLSPPLQSYLI